jgi:hypothetical protein
MLTQARVQGIAEPVTEQVDAERDQHQVAPGKITSHQAPLTAAFSLR